MVKKKRSTKHSHVSTSHYANSNEHTNKLLIENFISLQRAMTQMAGKFDHLSNNMEKLLGLFETSAKTFIDKKPSNMLTKEDKEFSDRINSLLEQNKTIAKTLLIVQQDIRDLNQSTPPQQIQMPTQQPMPMPMTQRQRMPMPQQYQPQQQNQSQIPMNSQEKYQQSPYPLGTQDDNNGQYISQENNQDSMPKKRRILPRF